MGAAPSRETHRRGLFTVPQSAPGGGTGGGGGVSGNSKKQDVVLIPLTREFFPSPECPLFIQFHKARCDAAVNYYFRQPGNPGDLSTIPNYAKSYRPPGEAEERRRRRAARRQRREEKEANTSNHNSALSSSSGSDCDENAEEEEEDGSYPSREALYKGVIDHVEDTLFDTDAEMREAYAWACAHPHTTMGPHGQKQRKVLPVLCAVAFRYDPAKLGPVTASAESNNTNNNNMNSGGGAAAASGGGGGNSAYQAAVENGVFVQGSIINIVGCFGFVSMEADVEDAAYRLHQQQQNSLNANNNTASSSSQHQHRGSGSVYQHDPYHKGNNNSHSLGSQGSNSISNSSPAPLLHTSGAFSDPHSGIGNNNNNNIIHTITGYPSSLPGLPPPVAAPLSAMVFLTKSAGEQNLGRVTYIAASTYYHQLIHAGVIHRRQSSATAANNTAAAANCSHTSNNAADCMPPGSQHLYNNHSGSNSCTSYYQQQQNQQPMLPSAPTYPAASPIATTPEMFLPPMETFSFSSLLTNIPILSFLYEMKCRWGYLGVLRTGTPTATGSLNSSFASHSNANNATNTTTTPLSTHHHHLQNNNNNQLNVSVSVGHNHRAVGGVGGGATHSAGGLSMIDHSRGQNITDEMEMWITADHMIHGRISRELASRLCWSLAERPEVMQERVTQLPSEEGGYWRYRGLTDRSRPPPLPGPGRIVSIHPKDVYVMGSDVLPGFDEGDILRFDPERLVWFADHAIPLEGVVLAAMRPFCKKAREADSMDAGWVTTLRVKDDQHNRSHANSLNQMFDFPVGAPSEAEKAAMAADASLTHEHEHVGAFYVYRFERDGVVYHHGTVPDFANPNKRKGNKQQQQQDGNNAQQQPRKASSAATPVAASLPTSSDAAHNNSKKINNSPGPTASLTTKTTQPQQQQQQHSTTTAPNASGVKQTTASSSTTTSVPVPATIASALFTLLPAPQTTPSAAATAANMSPPPAVQMLDVPLGSSPPMNGSRKGSEAAPATTAAPPPQPTATSYLPSRVTSTAIDAARRIMRNIYSLAYGAPTRGGDAAAAVGSSAASNMSGSRGVTPVSRSYPLTPQMLPSPVQPLGTPQYPRYHGSAVWPQSPIIPSPGSSVGAFPSVVVGNVNNNNNMGASRSALTPFNSSINNNVINTPLMASSPGDRPPSASAPMLVGGGGSGSMPDNQPQHHVRSHSRVLSRSGGSLQLLDEAFVNNSAPNAAAINNNNNTNTTTQQQQQPSEASQQPAAAAAAADQSGKGSSRRAKRYIDNGSYVWDWRKGSI